MELSLDELKEILQTEERFNPFSKKFDLQAFRDAMEAYDEPDDKTGDQLHFVFVAQDAYKKLVTGIYNLFSKSGYTSTQLKELFFHSFNQDFLESFSHEQEQLSEVQVDLLAIVLELIDTWPIPEGHSFIRNSVEESLSTLQATMPFVVQLFVLREMVYKKMVFGNHYVIWENDTKIRVVPEYLQLEKVRKAAFIRNHHITAPYIFGLSDQVKQNPHKSLEYDGNQRTQIKIKQGTSGKSTKSAHASVVITIYYSYLANTPLPVFEGLTLLQLSNIFTTILELTESVVLEMTGDNFSPCAYDEDELIQALADCHQLPVSAISKFLSVLIADSSQPYFWNKPFYQCDYRLFFHHLVFVAPNFNLYFDEWLRTGGLDETFMQKAFKTHLIDNLGKKARYKFQLTPFSPDTSHEFASNLQYNLLSCTLLLEILTFSYPIREEDIEQIIAELAAATDRIKGKGDILKNNGHKEVIACLVCNQLTFSGLTFNGIPIADLSILNNYVNAGEYSKMAFFPTAQGLNGKPMVNLPYYDSEESFNQKLAVFLKMPVTVRMIVATLKSLDHAVMPPDAPFQVIIETVDAMTEDEQQEDHTEAAIEFLNYQHFLSPEEDQEILENTIQYHLSNLFHRMAHRADAAPEVQLEELRKTLANSRNIGRQHLNTYIFHAIQLIPEHTVDPLLFEKPEFTPEFLDMWNNDLEKLVERLREHLDNKIYLPEMLFPEIFTREEEALLIIFADFYLQEIGYRQIDMTGISHAFLALAIFYGFRERHATMELFYNASGNLVSLLNYSHHYEKARELCGSILTIASSHDQHAYAWNILFNSCTIQQDAYQAAIYGCLFFTSLITMKEVSTKLVTDGYANLLKYFRNFDDYKEAFTLFEWTKQLQLNDYDRHKMAVIYFNMLLENVHRLPEKLDEIYTYLDQYLDSIIHSGPKAGIPWLAILYQMVKAGDVGYYTINESIHGYIKKLEDSNDEAEVTAIRDKTMGADEKSKAMFIDSILNSLQTRKARQHATESMQMTYLANHMIRYALVKGDTEAFLLAGLVLNDQTFTYTDRTYTEDSITQMETTHDEALEYRLNHYQQYVLSVLSLKKDQVLLWIFRADMENICLMIDANRHIAIFRLPQWNNSKLIEWTFNIRNFHWNANNEKNYDLRLQEADHDSLIQFFSFTSLTDILLTTCNEILICFSTELSMMPHNLMVAGNQFLEEKYAVCNILSIENFLHHQNDILLPRNYTSAGWIPIVDKNETVSMGYDKLEPLLTQRGAVIQTSRYPETPLQADVNVFLAHGIREFAGFRFVRTSDDKSSAIVQPSRVFGKGKIAVLFICNSGSSVEDAFGHQVISLSAELLKAGYKAVIAPFWPYDVSMSGRWLKAFLCHLDEGYTVNESVYHANKELSQYDESTSESFFAPQGCLAMHLYGNPNIKVNLADNT